MKLLKQFWAQSVILGLFISFLVLSTMTSFLFQIRKVKEYNAEIVEIDAQIKDTKDEISKLKKISNGDLENVAREELGMIKENEIIYVNSGERDN